MAKRKRAVAVNPRSVGNDDKEIGLRIRLLRLDKKMSQDELGRRLGVSFQQVQKYEKGTNRLSLSRSIQICKALDCSLDQLADQAFIRDTHKFNHLRYKLAASFEGLDERVALRLRHLIDTIKDPSE